MYVLNDRIDAKYPRYMLENALNQNDVTKKYAWNQPKLEHFDIVFGHLDSDIEVKYQCSLGLAYITEVL